jgi:hypothetical protein
MAVAASDGAQVDMGIEAAFWPDQVREEADLLSIVSPVLPILAESCHG